MRKRVLSFLLCAVMVAGLLPTTALAGDSEQTATAKTVMLGTSGISGGQADSIYFGNYEQDNDSSNGKEPIKWRVLDAANNHKTSESGTTTTSLFLLSDKLLEVFQYHKESEEVTWKTSTMRSWLNGLDENKGNGDAAIDYKDDNFINTAFSEKERGAIANTNVVTWSSDSATDKIFLLSKDEAENINYFPNGNSSRIGTNTAYVAAGGKTHSQWMGNDGDSRLWWLRDRGTNAYDAAYVNEYGEPKAPGSTVNDENMAVRPAFNLDLDSVLFTSAAAENKPGSFSKAQSYTGNEWKLTLKDTNATITGSVKLQNSSQSEVTELTVGYANNDKSFVLSNVALSNADGYSNLTAALTNGKGEILYYGSIGTGTTAPEKIDLPANLPAGSYTLSVYGEQWNGDYMTDYATASAITTTIEVKSKEQDQPTPPPPPSYDDDDDDDDDYTPPKSPAQQAADKIESAQPGDKVELKLPSSGKVDKEVFEALAGNDVTLEITLPGGLTWTVNGQDIPKGTNFSDLNLGVSLGTNGISAEVINKVTGEKTSIQLTLSHNGPFGFALTLTAPLGKENAGFWANLYHFNEKTGVLDYESSTIIGTDGAAALKLTHASQYAIVIDDKSHEPKTPWENPFTDVSENDWFYENVRYSCENGLITGTSATTFAPTLPTTRAMLMTILARLDGADTAPSGDIWYEKGMAWAVQNKISDGTAPEASITREQLAVMLYNYAKQGEEIAETVALSGFADAAQVSAWALDALRWAVSEGIITGTSATTLAPQGNATRAEAAAMLQRYLEK